MAADYSVADALQAVRGVYGKAEERDGEELRWASVTHEKHPIASNISIGKWGWEPG